MLLLLVNKTNIEYIFKNHNTSIAAYVVAPKTVLYVPHAHVQEQFVSNKV